jgi:CheY-like chemotaxis protein
MPRVGHTLLVVEDDADSRVVIAALLTLQGYDVVTAKDGSEGLALSQRVRPRLILLDLMMPIMDGATFLRRQRALPDIAGIPVVLVSAHPEANRVASELGAIAVVAKPIRFEHLTATVEAICNVQGV